jgi:hypothetical protein
MWSKQMIWSVSRGGCHYHSSCCNQIYLLFTRFEINTTFLITMLLAAFFIYLCLLTSVDNLQRIANGTTTTMPSDKEDTFHQKRYCRSYWVFTFTSFICIVESFRLAFSLYYSSHYISSSQMGSEKKQIIEWDIDRLGNAGMIWM